MLLGLGTYRVLGPRQSGSAKHRPKHETRSTTTASEQAVAPRACWKSARTFVTGTGDNITSGHIAAKNFCKVTRPFNTTAEAGKGVDTTDGKGTELDVKLSRRIDAVGKTVDRTGAKLEQKMEASFHEMRTSMSADRETTLTTFLANNCKGNAGCNT